MPRYQVRLKSPDDNGVSSIRIFASSPESAAAMFADRVKVVEEGDTVEVESAEPPTWPSSLTSPVSFRMKLAFYWTATEIEDEDFTEPAPAGAETQTAVEDEAEKGDSPPSARRESDLRSAGGLIVTEEMLEDLGRTDFESAVFQLQRQLGAASPNQRRPVAQPLRVIADAIIRDCIGPREEVGSPTSDDAWIRPDVSLTDALLEAMPDFDCGVLEYDGVYFDIERDRDGDRILHVSPHRPRIAPLLDYARSRS